VAIASQNEVSFSVFALLAGGEEDTPRSKRQSEPSVPWANSMMKQGQAQWDISGHDRLDERGEKSTRS
jgi:hypothetical protein